MSDSFPRMRASSENTGDTIVENISMRVVWRAFVDKKLTVQPPTWRDRRFLSRDRLNPGNERERNPIYHQLGSVDKSPLGYLLTELSTGENRNVSRVSAHASNRTGAKPPTSYRFKQLNRRPSHEAIRWVHVSVQ